MCCILVDKALSYINEHSMLKSGEKVLVALSGGPDSVCLIHILYNLQEKLNIQCFAAHLNHCLRGEEADKDEAYSEELCRRLNIPFFSKRVDINALAAKRGISVEMAGREARYEFFDEIKNKYQIHKIAVAHNANDQAETILMRFMRGTGSEGLRGIKPIREGIFIRPILCLSREEIEEYCRINNLNPRIDKTNLEDIYYRNKIRLQLLPYIEENFNSNIISTLNRLAYLIDSDNDYIQEQVDINYNIFCNANEEGLLIHKDAFKLHKAILSRLIRKAYNEFSGIHSNFQKVHVDDIIFLQKQGTGRSINLPGGICAENRYYDIYFFKKDSKGELVFNEKYIIENINDIKSKLYEGFNIYLQDFRLNLNIKRLELKPSLNLKTNNTTKYFDLNKIKGSILLRNRKAGDRFSPLGMKGSKKLKDLFIDLKVPQDKRNDIPLLCFDDDIAWIIGYNISDKYKVDKNTKNILQIKLESEAFFE